MYQLLYLLLLSVLLLPTLNFIISDLTPNPCCRRLINLCSNISVPYLFVSRTSIFLSPPLVLICSDSRSSRVLTLPLCRVACAWIGRWSSSGHIAYARNDLIPGATSSSPPASSDHCSLRRIHISPYRRRLHGRCYACQPLSLGPCSPLSCRCPDG
jgi:hypothetical protein